MLVRVEIRTRQGSLLSLPLEDVSGGIAILGIEGLDPVKATMVSSSFAGEDGEQYHSSRRESRNLKFKMGYEPDYVDTVVADVRKRLYGFLMPKSEVNLRFVMDDGLYLDILGRVESFDSPLFTNEPAADISLMCFNPDFVDPNPVTFSGMSTDLDTEILRTYLGTVETGVVFTLRPDRNLNEFTIYHRPPDGSTRQLDFAFPLLADDVLEISTVTGAKGAYLTREDTVSSVLYGVSPQSNWIEWQYGDNYFRVYATGAPIPFDVQYFTRYGGL